MVKNYSQPQKKLVSTIAVNSQVKLKPNTISNILAYSKALTVYKCGNINAIAIVAN